MHSWPVQAIAGLHGLGVGVQEMGVSRVATLTVGLAHLSTQDHQTPPPPPPPQSATATTPGSDSKTMVVVREDFRQTRGLWALGLWVLGDRIGRGEKCIGPKITCSENLMQMDACALILTFLCLLMLIDIQ